MALVDYTIPDPGTNQQYPKGVRVVAWLAMGANDVGKAYKAPGATTKSVQSIGTRTVQLQGSNLPGDLSTSSTSTEWDLIGQTASIVEVTVPAYQIRPVADSATTADIDVYVLIRTDTRG